MIHYAFCNECKQMLIDGDNSHSALCSQYKLGDDTMELTGAVNNVVVEKDNPIEQTVSVSCPVCNAPKGQMCDPHKRMNHAERFVAAFAKDARKVSGPYGE